MSTTFLVLVLVCSYNRVFELDTNGLFSLLWSTNSGIGVEDESSLSLHQSYI